MTTLRTERLSLVPFAASDLELYHQINTHPYVRQYLWDDEVIELTTSKDILETNRQLFENEGWGLWKVAIQNTGEVAGFVGLWTFFDEDQPQLIYGLLPSFTGQGLATEASAAVITYAFETLGFDYLTAAMDEPHRASQHVAERLNMQMTEKREENGKPTVFYRVDASSRQMAL